MGFYKSKRTLESSTSSGEGGGQRHNKRPAPSTTNLQNCEINGTPGYCSLDDVRHVVREAMESANSYLMELIDSRIQNTLSNFIPEVHSLRSAIPELVREGTEHAISHMKQVERPSSKYNANARNLLLCFKSKLSLPLYTGMKLEGHQGCPIQVELIDANTGHVVTSGPESSVKLDVVVLKGDFNKEDNKSWPLAEFEHGMVKEREGRRPLLTGELHVNLVNGVGELGDLRFTDNSSWNSSKKFRIGVKVASGFCDGILVQEAVTEAFSVKDQRGESYKKHHPPEADDEVWRLEKIGKDGVYHKRLNEEGIYTVEEFLRHVVGDSKKLKTILGSGMTKKKWSVLINHANTCRPKEKSYAYYCHDKKSDGVVINNLCQLKSLITAGVYQTMEQLSDSQKVHAGNLVKAASKNWNRVIEFSAESFSGPMLSKSLIVDPVEIPENQQLCGIQSDCCLTPLNFLGTRDSTAGFHNVNRNHSVGITPTSLIPSHNTNLTSIISEQDPWNQQETFGNEVVQCTEQQESQPFCWSSSLPFYEE